MFCIVDGQDFLGNRWIFKIDLQAFAAGLLTFEGNFLNGKYFTIRHFQSVIGYFFFNKPSFMRFVRMYRNCKITMNGVVFVRFL
jgi:hypothetical protein